MCAPWARVSGRLLPLAATGIEVSARCQGKRAGE